MIKIAYFNFIQVKHSMGALKKAPENILKDKNAGNCLFFRCPENAEKNQ